MSIFLMRLLVPAILFFAAVSPAWAANPANEARQAWQLLDYIAVDYAGAVRNGQPSEFAGQKHAAFHVHVRVHEAGDQVTINRAGNLFDGRDPTLLDSERCRKDPAPQDVNEVGGERESGHSCE